MGSKIIKSKGKLKSIGANDKLINIKSDYFLRKVFDNIPKKISLEIIKYNKNIQKRLNINISNYKEYSEIFSSIEIEIIPMKKHKYSQFINIFKGYEKYYHIYFNTVKGTLLIIKKKKLKERILVLMIKFKK